MPNPFVRSVEDFLSDNVVNSRAAAEMSSVMSSAQDRVGRVTKDIQQMIGAGKQQEPETVTKQSANQEEMASKYVSRYQYDSNGGSQSPAKVSVPDPTKSESRYDSHDRYVTTQDLGPISRSDNTTKKEDEKKAEAANRGAITIKGELTIKADGLGHLEAQSQGAAPGGD